MRVFISYSRKSRKVRDGIADALRKAGHHPLFDENDIKPREDIAKSVVQLLGDSDALVAYLDVKALESAAVREELIRAHSLDLPIFPVVHKRAVKDLPWFLHSPRSFRFDRVVDVPALLPEVVAAIDDDQRLRETQSIRRTIGRMNSRVVDMSIDRGICDAERPWTFTLVEELVENVDRELASLSKGHYRSLVSEGANFLLRAKPVFEAADSVCAVSLDDVSKFWTSKDLKDQRFAKAYVDSQPARTQRLFVFSRAASAHHHTTVLNIHHRRYGESGRVYLCSSDSYQTVAEEVFTSGPDSTWASTDYAVLEYQSAGSAPIAYRATLNGDSFECTRQAKLSAIELDADALKRVFESIGELRPGEVDDRFNIMRWKLDLQREYEAWSAGLRRLFGDPQPDVVHMVFFADRAFESEEALAQLHVTVADLRELLDQQQHDEDSPFPVKDLWFGDYSSVRAFDAISEGQIINELRDDFRYRYVLFMRFHDSKALRAYYEDRRHSEIRHALYDAVLRSLSTARMADAGRTRELLDGPGPSAYESNEIAAKEFMVRADFKELDSIDDLVRRTPYRPKIVM